jgi:hypothetical protein
LQWELKIQLDEIFIIFTYIYANNTLYKRIIVIIMFPWLIINKYYN